MAHHSVCFLKVVSAQNVFQKDLHGVYLVEVGEGARLGVSLLVFSLQQLFYLLLLDCLLAILYFHEFIQVALFQCFVFGWLPDQLEQLVVDLNLLDVHLQLSVHLLLVYQLLVLLVRNELAIDSGVMEYLATVEELVVQLELGVLVHLELLLFQLLLVDHVLLHFEVVLLLFQHLLLDLLLLHLLLFLL